MVEFRAAICAAGTFSSAILRLMVLVETLAASLLDSNQLFTLTTLTDSKQLNFSPTVKSSRSFIAELYDENHFGQSIVLP